MSNTKTAIEWLWEQLPKGFTNAGSSQDLYVQAKQMEKEQIVNAFHQGATNMGATIMNKESELNGLTYYTETYQSEKTQIYHAYKGELIKDENGNLKPKKNEQ